jgi:Skp family chaperone for outer membrane proteins
LFAGGDGVEETMNMRMTAVLFGLAALGWSGAALAEVSCAKPAAPAAVDGSKATLEEVLAAKKAVTDFMAASDNYQTCVLNGLEAARKAAKDEKRKLDPSVSKAADADIAANQADKEKVGADFNAAARAFKAAHPS